MIAAVPRCACPGTTSREILVGEPVEACPECGGARALEAAPAPSRWIVAEVSRNWPPTSPGSLPLSARFEQVLATNQARGYRLHSWRMTSTAVEDAYNRPGIVETIVAVFEPAPRITRDPVPTTAP